MQARFKAKSLIFFCSLIVVFWLFSGCGSQESEQQNQEAITVADTLQIRFASFNAWLYREEAGQLLRDLQTDTVQQIQLVAEIIQRVRPDVLALMEFDYDSTGQCLDLFREQYLAKSWNGTEPIEYPYALAFPSNTGIPSGFDLNRNGRTTDPEDAWGYGTHPGQYAFAIFSKYPIGEQAVRSFQYFKWSAMPGALRPTIPTTGESYYSQETWQELRLSSKNHVDVPISIGSETIHALLMHPTPPVFDGPEDRNGRRNYDEIRLFADYLLNADYLVDDQGGIGGLPTGAKFVLMGDFNADPNDGDSYENAVSQLLDHPLVNRRVAKGDLIPASDGGVYNTETGRAELRTQLGDPQHDTSIFGLRLDYALPSSNLTAVGSGIFWPTPEDPLYYLVKDNASSDHLLVWADVLVIDPKRSR